MIVPAITLVPSLPVEPGGQTADVTVQVPTYGNAGYITTVTISRGAEPGGEVIQSGELRYEADDDSDNNEQFVTLPNIPYEDGQVFTVRVIVDFDKDTMQGRAGTKTLTIDNDEEYIRFVDTDDYMGETGDMHRSSDR